MKKSIIFLTTLILFLFSVWTEGVFGAERSDERSDIESITNAALDYIEGWYEGNAERMERALHSDLAKRGIFVDPDTGKTVVRSVGAEDMVKYTKEGKGQNLEKKAKIKLEVLDKFKNTACVKIVSPDYIDYLHLARFEDKWAIVNVIWEMNK